MRKLAFLTGPPSAGKSTLSSATGLPVLQGDAALFHGFQAMGHPELGNKILLRSKWEFLRPALDEHFIDYHRHWLNEHAPCPNVLAESWIYCRSAWRKLALRALTQDNDAPQVRLFALLPDYAVYRERRNRQLEAANMALNEATTRHLHEQFTAELQHFDILHEAGDGERLMQALQAWLAD